MEGLGATHCRDACAVIASLRQEPGAEVLKELMEQPTTFLAMHVCNLGEVSYDFFREDGLTVARTALRNGIWSQARRKPQGGAPKGQRDVVGSSTPSRAGPWGPGVPQPGVASGALRCYSRGL